MHLINWTCSVLPPELQYCTGQIITAKSAPGRMQQYGAIAGTGGKTADLASQLIWTQALANSDE